MPTIYMRSEEEDEEVEVDEDAAAAAEPQNRQYRIGSYRKPSRTVLPRFLLSIKPRSFCKSPSGLRLELTRIYHVYAYINVCLQLSGLDDQ